VLANVATPIGNAYVTAAVAPFGDSAVAGWAIVGRIIPVAFGAIYALSGAVGPVLGQNIGAGAESRVRAVLTESLKVNLWFTLAAWAALFVLARPLVALFGATGQAADLIMLFCRWLSPLFGFLGALFVANAAFNVMGRAHYATIFNWARATIGTIPFAEVGGRLAGAEGVIAGNMVGGIIFGVAAVLACYGLFEGRRVKR
jgi:Na+-driven multidrug efflux pump